MKERDREERGKGMKVNLIVLGFNDTSTLEGHFVSSNESEETEEIKLEKVSIGRGCPRQMPFRKRVYM